MEKNSKFLTVRCIKIIDDLSMNDDPKNIIFVDSSKKFLLGSQTFVKRASTSLIILGKSAHGWSSLLSNGIECEVFEDQELLPQLNQVYVNRSLAKKLDIGLNQKLKLIINDCSKMKQIARYPHDLKVPISNNGIILMWGGLDWMFYPNGILAIVVHIDDSIVDCDGIGFSSLFFQNIWGVASKHVQPGERVCKLTRNDSIVTTQAWLASGKNALPGSGIRLNKNLAKALNAKIGSLIFIKHFACGISKGEFVTTS